MTDQLALVSRLPRSCIRYQSQENLLKRTKIVLAVPSYHRQRLSGIRRGWCPSQSRKDYNPKRTKRVIRSDAGVTHRLSLSARVVSAVDRQVKAKRQDEKRLQHRRNRHAREIQRSPTPRLLRHRDSESSEPSQRPAPPAGGEAGSNQLNVDITRIIKGRSGAMEGLPGSVSSAPGLKPGGGAGCASSEDTGSRAAGRLPAGRRAIFRALDRPADQRWSGARPRAAP